MIHDKAVLAAEAAEAAGAQGAFWEMLDRIYAGQSEWVSVTPDKAQEIFVGYARELGLDAEQLAADLDAGTFRDKVMESAREAERKGLPGTPTFFINGQYLEALDYFYMDALVQLALLEPRQYDAPPEMTIDPNKHYQATIKTDKGDIVVELDAQAAPVTVNNFVFLAREGWYDGVTFFRVLPGFVAQAGDPTNTGIGGPGYELPAEIGLLHEAGAIAMARRSDQINPERKSSGSQFYIAIEPLPDLDNKYTVFGYVTEGMDVVRALTPRDPTQNPDAPPGDKIITIEIQESD